MIMSDSFSDYSGLILGSASKFNTLKKKVIRGRPICFPSSSGSKSRSITIHDYMNNPMSNSGSVSFCIQKCVMLFTQTKHE